MDLVEQHGGYVAKLRVGLNPRQEHTVGHGDDARRLSNLGVEPRGVADGLAGPLAELACHELRRRARS